MKSSLGLFLSCWEMKPMPRGRHGTCWSLALSCSGKQNFSTIFVFMLVMYVPKSFLFIWHLSVFSKLTQSFLIYVRERERRKDRAASTKMRKTFGRKFSLLTLDSHVLERSFR